MISFGACSRDPFSSLWLHFDYIVGMKKALLYLATVLKLTKGIVKY